MKLPMLPGGRQERTRLTAFGGWDSSPGAAEGEFQAMRNLTSDRFPLLSPRKRRGIAASPEKPGGLCWRDTLCWVDGRYFVMGQYRIDLALTETEPDRPKQLVSMGAYVIILPDKKYINTADITDFGSLEAEFVTQAPTAFSLCGADGSEYIPDFTQAEVPTQAQGMQLWLDTGGEKPVLKQWSAASALWVEIGATYVRLSSPGIGRAFGLYDGITLEGLSGALSDETGAAIADTGELAALEGAAVLWGRGEDHILIPGILTRPRTVREPITLSRRMPETDFVVERENRLWGCRYGTDRQGRVVNEIYASKLGDFKNWNCYMGLSTDSYTASLGADGPFTGAAVLAGCPIFFREGCLHKVYGDWPENFSVQTTVCRGVQQGCGRSLAMVGERLYYKAREGICVYDGALPRLISQKLGDTAYEKAVAGGHAGKYYISMARAGTGERSLFVWDTQRQLWHREDSFRPGCFCSGGSELYAIDADTGEITAMLGTGEVREGPVRWMAQTAEMGLREPGSGQVCRLLLELELAGGAWLDASVQYDSRGSWQRCGRLTGPGKRTFRIPVRARRCDHFRLRLEGEGEAALYSLTRICRKGAQAQ